jgi:hypothetical protein
MGDAVWLARGSLMLRVMSQRPVVGLKSSARQAVGPAPARVLIVTAVCPRRGTVIDPVAVQRSVRGV